MPEPIVRGLIRARNEELIIKETLDHFGEWCDEIYVYDDASTDKTLEIVKGHPKVKGTIQGTIWDTDREKAEWEHREKIYQIAAVSAEPWDWFIYFDADERMELDKKFLYDTKNDYIICRLFDFYITGADKDREYNGNLIELRDYIGPEYRDILMCFRQRCKPKWHLPDQRIPSLFGFGIHGIQEGYIRHYGKSISVAHWEDTVNYYSKHFPKYSAKWEARRGKAIHTESDFGAPLIKWSERKTKGVKL